MESRWGYDLGKARSCQEDCGPLVKSPDVAQFLHGVSRDLDLVTVAASYVYGVTHS